MAASEELDLRGLLCPLPVIRTGQHLAGLPAGARVAVRCTDPGVREDLPTWCRMHGHELLGIEEQGPEILVCIRKGHDART